MRCAGWPTPGMRRRRSWARTSTPSGANRPQPRLLDRLGRRRRHERAGTIVAAGRRGAGLGHRGGRRARRRRSDRSRPSRVLTRVTAARADGFEVGDDGSRRRAPVPAPAVALSGGERSRERHAGVAGRRADPADRRCARPAGAADADAAHDIEEAFASPTSARAADGAGRGVAGSAGRRRGGLAGDEPGPHRGPDRRDDTRTAPATDRRIPPAGRQHRRRAVGHAGRRQPGQHRPGDRGQAEDDPDPKGRIAFYRACSARSTTRPAAAAALTARSWRSTRIGRRWSN